MVTISEKISQEQWNHLQSILDSDCSASITEIGGYLCNRFFGAFVGQQLVGIASLTFLDDGEWELYKIYVHPEFRRQNIATLLAQATMKTLSEEGASSLSLEVSGLGFPFWRNFKTTFSILTLSANRLQFNLVSTPDSPIELGHPA